MIKDVCYLPSGRIFILNSNGYIIECTEMRDVSVHGDEHLMVRNTQDPRIIWRHLKPYQDKWLLTVSTQKGCVHNCKFCDVAPLPFEGNLTQKEIEDQVRLILENTSYVKKSNKVKIGFARMGEPAHNIDNVLGAMKNLPFISNEMERDFRWLPCFNSILPKKTMFGISGIDVINKVIEVKENHYNGFLHFQISCNSTDEMKRKQLFGGADVLSIETIINEINKYKITNRTITLNFIMINDVEVDVQKLKKMGLRNDKFAIKLIPLNNTKQSEENDLTTVANYSNYDKLLQIKKEFENEGIPVVVDAIAKCEEAGLCCGQLAQIYM